MTVVRHLAHDLQDFARFASPAGGGTGAPDHRPGDPVAARAQCAGGLPRARHVRACHGLAEGEVQTLAWSDVDRAHRRITLRRAHSKTAEPRVLTLVGELGALIDRRWAACEYPTADHGTGLSPFVFHRGGQPIGDFRKAWATACSTAGVAGTLFHDLRRSAVRTSRRPASRRASP